MKSFIKRARSRSPFQRRGKTSEELIDSIKEFETKQKQKQQQASERSSEDAENHKQVASSSSSVSDSDSSADSLTDPRERQEQHRRQPAQQHRLPPPILKPPQQRRPFFENPSETAAIEVVLENSSNTEHSATASTAPGTRHQQQSLNQQQPLSPSLLSTFGGSNRRRFPLPSQGNSTEKNNKENSTTTKPHQKCHHRSLSSPPSAAIALPDLGTRDFERRNDTSSNNNNSNSGKSCSTATTPKSNSGPTTSSASSLARKKFKEKYMSSTSATTIPAKGISHTPPPPPGVSRSSSNNSESDDLVDTKEEGVKRDDGGGGGGLGNHRLCFPFNHVSGGSMNSAKKIGGFEGEGLLKQNGFVVGSGQYIPASSMATATTATSSTTTATNTTSNTPILQSPQSTTSHQPQQRGRFVTPSAGRTQSSEDNSTTKDTRGRSASRGRSVSRGRSASRGRSSSRGRSAILRNPFSRRSSNKSPGRNTASAATNTGSEVPLSPTNSAQPLVTPPARHPYAKQTTWAITPNKKPENVVVLSPYRRHSKLGSFSHGLPPPLTASSNTIGSPSGSFPAFSSTAFPGNRNHFSPSLSQQQTNNEKNTASSTNKKKEDSPSDLSSFSMFESPKYWPQQLNLFSNSNKKRDHYATPNDTDSPSEGQKVRNPENGFPSELLIPTKSALEENQPPTSTAAAVSTALRRKKNKATASSKSSSPMTKEATAPVEMMRSKSLLSEISTPSSLNGFGSSVGGIAVDTELKRILRSIESSLEEATKKGQRIDRRMVYATLMEISAGIGDESEREAMQKELETLIAVSGSIEKKDTENDYPMSENHRNCITEGSERNSEDRLVRRICDDDEEELAASAGDAIAPHDSDPPTKKVVRIRTPEKDLQLQDESDEDDWSNEDSDGFSSKEDTVSFMQEFFSLGQFLGFGGYSDDSQLLPSREGSHGIRKPKLRDNNNIPLLRTYSEDTGSSDGTSAFTSQPAWNSGGGNSDVRNDNSDRQSALPKDATTTEEETTMATNDTPGRSWWRLGRGAGCYQTEDGSSSNNRLENVSRFHKKKSSGPLYRSNNMTHDPPRKNSADKAQPTKGVSDRGPDVLPTPSDTAVPRESRRQRKDKRAITIAPPRLRLFHNQNNQNRYGEEESSSEDVGSDNLSVSSIESDQYDEPREDDRYVTATSRRDPSVRRRSKSLDGRRGTIF